VPGEVVSVTPLDDAVAEEWVRETDEPDLRGVTAVRFQGRDRWQWQLTASIALLTLDEPQATELHEQIGSALRDVAGVVDVAQEDRETWVVSGTPSGEALVQAAALVVDAVADGR
jgi:hypothetical protein